MTAPAIRVEHVWKRFRVQRERPDSLKERITARRRGRQEEFWALKDVSLEVPHGSFYGLVGHNGSGKSSLLRILAGIYRPTRGQVTTDGRISALLELGAGFHPDLTGRENIYLNAAILGLSRKETDLLYDRIVEFSGLAEFIDTPVKHFSSGMYVRLGFSVAVHVEPQILLVDEVIAVGDEEFQRRCFDHLNRLRRRGVTIVLVTHALGFVQAMCDDATWLDHGEVRAQEAAAEVVKDYVAQVNRDEIDRIELDIAAGREGVTRFGTTVAIDHVELLDAEGRPTPVGTSLEPLTVRIHWRANDPVEWPLFSFAVENESAVHVANPGMRPPRRPMPVFLGEGHVDYRIERLLLSPGEYTLTLAAHDAAGMTVLDRREEAFVLRVQPGADLVVGLTDLNGHWEPLAGRETAEPAVAGVGQPEVNAPPVVDAAGEGPG